MPIIGETEHDAPGKARSESCFYLPPKHFRFAGFALPQGVKTEFTEQ